MNRINTAFETTKREGRKALITFTMAGDPDAATSLAILERLAESADIVEIGMPFSDPMADGPAIQAAGLRALESGMTLHGVFELVQKFRSKNTDTPIVLMGYFNPVLKYGADKFMKDCKAFGVDGLIIVDIPPEESQEIAAPAQQNGIALIRLLTPTTTPARLPKILEGAGGFLYYVSIIGVTGTASADPAKVGAHIAEIKKATDLPIVAGFGIKTADDVARMAALADGVVVGSALVDLAASVKDASDAVQTVAVEGAKLARAAGRH